MRYLPGRALPPYAFLPGRDPHPTRDPDGHSYGQEDDPPPFLPAARWRDNQAYLWGADLYNQAFFWEAHEAWEGLWHASKRDRIQALFLQGLIQCGAAWLKITMRQERGVTRLADLALEKLEEVARSNDGGYMGLDLDLFVPEVRAFACSGAATIEGFPPLRLDVDSRS